MDAEYVKSGLINQWKDTSCHWKLHSIFYQSQVIFLYRFILFKQRSLLITSFNLCLPGGNHIMPLKELNLIQGKNKNSTINWSDIESLREPLKGLSTLRSRFHKMKGKHLLSIHLQNWKILVCSKDISIFVFWRKPWVYTF